MPPDTPRLVTSVLRRCLQKDPNRRLHDIADARLEIQEAMLETDAPDLSGRRRPGTFSRAVPWIVAAIVLSGAIRDVSLVSPYRRAASDRDSSGGDAAANRRAVHRPFGRGLVTRREPRGVRRN